MIDVIFKLIICFILVYSFIIILAAIVNFYNYLFKKGDK